MRFLSLILLGLFVSYGAWAQQESAEPGVNLWFRDFSVAADSARKNKKELLVVLQPYQQAPLTITADQYNALLKYSLLTAYYGSLPAELRNEIQGFEKKLNFTFGNVGLAVIHFEEKTGAPHVVALLPQKYMTESGTAAFFVPKEGSLTQRTLHWAALMYHLPALDGRLYEKFEPMTKMALQMFTTRLYVPLLPGAGNDYSQLPSKTPADPRLDLFQASLSIVQDWAVDREFFDNAIRPYDYGWYDLVRSENGWFSMAFLAFVPGSANSSRAYYLRGLR